MRKSLFLGVLLLALTSIFLTPSGSRAYADSQEIAITPTEEHLSVNAGSTNSGFFHVVNQGKTAFSYTVYATPYAVKGEVYTPEFIRLPGAPDVVSWIKLSSSGGVLQPNQRQTVNYSLSVPKNTPPGGYYFAVFAQTKNATTKQGVVIYGRVGILFYINIAGNTVNSGKLLSLSVPFLQYPPLTSNIKVIDSGDLNFDSNIYYQINDIFGGTRYVLNGQKNLLPKTIRLISLSWGKSPSIGLFKVSGFVIVLSHRYTLGSKYVLVMSKAARSYFILSLSLLIVALILYNIFGKNRKGSK